MKQLMKQSGGFCAVENGEVIAEFPLPIAGLMSKDRCRGCGQTAGVNGESKSTVRKLLSGKPGVSDYYFITFSMSLCENI